VRQRTQLTGPNRPNDSNPTLKRRANATRNHAQQSSTHRGAQRQTPSTHHTPRHRRRCAGTRTCPHADAPISAHRAGPNDEAVAGTRHRSRCGGLRQPGGHGGGTAPDPIPNSDVKPTSAYDTAPQGAGKSVAARSSEPPPHTNYAHTIHRHTMRRRSPNTAAPSNTHTPCRGVEQPGSSSGS